MVFVAAIGHLYDAHPDRGVFRSQDGGRTWRKVLFKNNNVGAVDVVIDPANSQVVYAALWNTRRPPWYTYQPSNGPGGGIFKSTDGGTTWNSADQRSAGRVHRPERDRRSRRAIRGACTPSSTTSCPKALPAGSAGARHAGVARRRRRRPRARRAAGGAAAAGAPHVAGRAVSIGRCRRDVDEDVRATTRSGAAAGTSRRSPSIRRTPTSSTCRTCRVSRSKDGGRTWVALRGSPGGDDYHQAWVSPDDSNTMILASDQGAIITRNAHDRGSRRRHLELVAQSADRADLPRVIGLPLSVLGDRRAAGQRRRRRAHARQVRGDLDARLGADRCGRRERHDGRRSAASGHRLRRHGQRGGISS